MAGLYIHIPFCASRCIYCGFYSTTLLHLQDRYVDALCREMEIRSEELEARGEDIETIYLGGGTPSQLSPDNLRRLFHYIKKVYGFSPSNLNPNENSELCTMNYELCAAPDSPLKEVTIECNPDDLTEEYVATLSQLPINRISMGVQTFSDERLRFLHRRHTSDEVRTAVSRLRAAGIRNISIDLMFGFPEETLDEWKRDIDEALALDVEHISAYSLMYEEGTRLYDMMKKLAPISEETERQMYELLIDRLEAAGYEHYEISNFAKKHRSLHNSNYWNGTHYIGIGAAAHSYDGNSRQWNVSDIRAYMESIERGEIPCERELLDDDTRYNDLITTALRTREGILLSSLTPKYRDYLMQNAQTALLGGLLHIDNDHIHLTRQGLFVSDNVMSDLIWV